MSHGRNVLGVELGLGERVLTGCLVVSLPGPGLVGAADLHRLVAAGGIRWDAVVGAAMWHRVPGLVLVGLNQPGRRPLPHHDDQTTQAHCHTLALKACVLSTTGYL